MTSEEAQQLIAAGESLTVEFKRELSTNRARDICKEIAALATMQGGHLFLGVDDGGSITGIADPEEAAARIESWVAAHVAPAPRISLSIVELADARLVHVRIAEGAAPLYYYSNRPYLRVGTISVVATPDQVEYLVATGKMVSEMRANVARMASLETTLHPGRHVAAAIMGQGELATMNYASVRDRLFNDLCELLQARAKGRP